MIKIKIKIKTTTHISLVHYSTWYFFHDSYTLAYNVFYSDIQDLPQEPTNIDPDLL